MGLEFDVVYSNNASVSLTTVHGVGGIEALIQLLGDPELEFVDEPLKEKARGFARAGFGVVSDFFTQGGVLTRDNRIDIQGIDGVFPFVGEVEKFREALDREGIIGLTGEKAEMGYGFDLRRLGVRRNMTMIISDQLGNRALNRVEGGRVTTFTTFGGDIYAIESLTAALELKVKRLWPQDERKVFSPATVVKQSYFDLSSMQAKSVIAYQEGLINPPKPLGFKEKVLDFLGFL